MNVCTFTGNVATTPELKGASKNVLTFRLAVNGRVFNPDSQQWEDDASFFDAVMYGNRASAIGAWLAKGQMVTIQAHARQNTWTADDGSQRSRVEFVVDDLVAAPRK